MNKNEQEYLVQKILTKYTEREHTELDALKKLDKKVKRPVSAFSCIFGSASALAMGTGMSLIMTDISESIGISEPLLPGLIIGIVGMAMVIINYPMYKRILKNRRKKYVNEIIALGDRAMRG